MFRKLRVLAAFFMVPIVVFSTPGTAAAATSEVVTFNLSGFIEGVVPGAEVQCKIGMLVHEVTGGANVIVSPTSYCAGGPDISPFGCQIAETDCGTWTLKFNSAGVQDCASGALSQGGDGGSISSVSVTLAGSIGLGSDCDPVEVCLAYDSEQWGVDEHREDCTTSTLDPPVIPDVAPCPAAGNVSFGPPHIISATYGPELNNYRGRVVYSGFAPSPPTGTMSWKFYYLLNPGPAQGNATRTIQGGAVYGIGHTNLSRPAGTPGGFTYETVSPLVTTEAEAAAWVGSQMAVGIGIYGIVGGESGLAGSLFNIPTTHSGNLNQTGLVGISDPSKCSYYWGEKVANHSDVNSTKDDPIGPVIGDPTVPIPDPPAVDPVADDEPPADEPSFWAGILGVLKAILAGVTKVWQLLAGLAGKIVDGITAAFDGLFVPDDGYLESRYTSIENKWADTSPAKYADAVSDFTVGSASGCEGMPLVLTLPGGVQVDQHIGAACSGPLASTAGIVRTVLSAVFVIGGLFACVRAVGSGLGWDPGVGRGAGA